MALFGSRYKRFFLDVAPIVFALVVAIVYFIAVVPNSGPFWKKYVLVAVILLVLDRIIIPWYMRTRLLRPIISYKKSKRAGKTFSQGELEKYYKDFAAYVPKHQLASAIAWCVAGLSMALASYFWIQHSGVAFIGILFTAFIAAAISIGLSYFILKERTGSLIEEVLAKLDQVPDVSAVRANFKLKTGISISLLVGLAFAAFGVFVYSKLTVSLDAFAIRSGEARAKATESLLKTTGENGWKELFSREENKNKNWTLAVVDDKGAIIRNAASGPFSGKMVADAVATAKALNRQGVVVTNHGSVWLHSIGNKRYFVLVPRQKSMRFIVVELTLAGSLFLVCSLLLLWGYIYLLSKDTAKTLRRAVSFGRHLAEGDLTNIPAIWADDELGAITDSLRVTFLGLRRITGEISNASETVEDEVITTTRVVGSLHRKVALQTRSADETNNSLGAMEEKMRQTSEAMENIANSTQEVSSAILEMQASVEEIARNADVLNKSVVTTVTSSNEIASSAEEVQGSADRLHGASQEAVSFLSELDASLEETRRNARGLSEISSRVTKDAETGFTSVAAVEEEILRTKTASVQSQQALMELTESIERIGQIVNVIQDVTEQTNLLSLNASIIAAGAGEYGKSFAVVATQIRELSARTAANAKEIRAVIGQLGESGRDMATAMDKTSKVVDMSTDLSRNAGQALRTIIESASDQEEMSKHIAAATEELAHGGQSASRVMQEIFQMIEAITRAMEEQTVTTRYLNEESEKVREVAGQIQNATGEQAKGARVISEAITRIREDSADTSTTVQSQTRETAAINKAMTSVFQSAKEIEDAFKDLSAASSRLQKGALILKQESRAFRIV